MARASGGSLDHYLTARTIKCIKLVVTAVTQVAVVAVVSILVESRFSNYQKPP
jgi:hypothetical protein